MALVLAPEAPVGTWLGALDAQIARAPSFFDDRPVILDLALLPREQPDVPGLFKALAGRGIQVIGTEGAHPSWTGLETVVRPLKGDGKPSRPMAVPDEPLKGPAESPAEPASLLVEQPVRSGQSVLFERGDVTVLGAVASGAEVVAGGSVHVYGPLRGRAVAGLSGQAAARIFCRRLDAELVAINGVYMTAEQMPPALRGRPVQIRLERDTIVLTPLD